MRQFQTPGSGAAPQKARPLMELLTAWTRYDGLRGLRTTLPRKDVPTADSMQWQSRVPLCLTSLIPNRHIKILLTVTYPSLTSPLQDTPGTLPHPPCKPVLYGHLRELVSPHPFPRPPALDPGALLLTWQAPAATQQRASRQRCALQEDASEGTLLSHTYDYHVYFCRIACAYPDL